MTRSSLLRLLLSLALLLIIVLAVPTAASACPRAVTTKYYGWVNSVPPYDNLCQYPNVGPPPIMTWQQIGQESTDCDGNYTSWGGPCQGGNASAANEVTTSTACTCHE